MWAVRVQLDRWPAADQARLTRGFEQFLKNPAGFEIIALIVDATLTAMAAQSRTDEDAPA